MSAVTIFRTVNGADFPATHIVLGYIKKR